MNLPKWLELTLFIIALLVVIVRIRYGLKTFSARKSIFGGDKRNFKIGIIANIGYALVTLLLGVYFLMQYLGNKSSTIVFEATLLFLLFVLIVEATFKKSN
ncbi:MAG: hypothetical protein ACYC56_00950 [Candidatus Aquicultor sp.]